jgi:hypothetical protein
LARNAEGRENVRLKKFIAISAAILGGLELGSRARYPATS